MTNNLGQRIKQLRIERGLTQTELGQLLGVASGNISRYESGTNNPDMKRLQQLADILKVPVSDLFTQGSFEHGPKLKGSVPLVSWVQAGNWNTVDDPLAPGEGERIITTYRAKAYTFALRVRGDSMEPKFPDGAIIIVEPDEIAHHNSYVIVRQNGDEATFKQLLIDGSQRLLKPLNPRYPIMEMKDDAVICGVVKRVEMDV
jgi:SOS-response transcriptional repressor LexA